MKYTLIPALYALSLCVSPAVFADDNRKDAWGGGAVVTLTASDQKKVEQDLLVASLRIEINHQDSRKVQAEINKAMKKAVDLLKSDPEIKVSTGNYYVYSYDPNPSPTPLSVAEQKKRLVWRGSQTVDIQSKESQKILDSVAQIQDMGFVMNGLNYVLSTELAEAERDELMVGALKKIQKKADLIAKTLGKSGYEITEVTVDGAYMPQPEPRMMMKSSMEMDGGQLAAAPVAAPGETEVTLSVSARVILKPVLNVKE